MRKTLLGVAGASVLLVVAANGSAQVNCGIVNKDLQMGRTAQDIAERMMISVDDVKRCEAQAKKDTAAPAAAPVTGEKPGAAPAGAGGDMKK